MRRRAILAAAVLVAAPLIAIRSYRPERETFAFSDVAGVPGFRHLDGGAVSPVGSDPLVGIRLPGDPAPPEPLAMGNLCTALFGPTPLPPGVVPVASFSDYYCPYCRDLTARLAVRNDAGLRITWHELPLLGEASVAAARAALAADLQGAYAAFQARLLRASFQATEGYLRELGRSLGLDPARLVAEASGDEVARRLAASARAAYTLGIGATPALVVGRTVVTGAIADDRLDALVEMERAAGPLPC